MVRTRALRACSVCCAAFGLLAGTAAAVEHRSVADSGAVLYDAPSLKATKLYLVSGGYPVEVAVVVEGWSKVRDAGGELAWIESKLLTDKRTVVVKARAAEVRQSPSEAAQLVFQAVHNVMLELVEYAADGWVKVKHRDGQTGFARENQLWGM